MSRMAQGIRAPELRQWLGKATISGLVAGLVAFHAALLWERVLSASLLDPAVGLRWGAAVLLLASLAMLRQTGVSLVRGREAMVVWTLVALLHAGIPAPGVQAATLTEAETRQWLVLGFALSTVLAWATDGGVAVRAPAPAWRRLDGVPRWHLPRAVLPEILSPRAPPAV